MFNYLINILEYLYSNVLRTANNRTFFSTLCAVFINEKYKIIEDQNEKK